MRRDSGQERECDARVSGKSETCYSMIMSEISDRKLTIEELTTPQVESTDPAYLMWRDERIRKALAADKLHPERRIPMSEILKRFGITSLRRSS